MKINTAPLIFALMGIFFSASAQKEAVFLKAAADSLAQYSYSRPIEKIHLHVDRYYYEPGDTIWFKAYVVAGENHNPSALSRVLYVELINNNDSLLKRIILPLNYGLANGDFVLADGSPGKYRLRAYTSWMRNVDEAFFCNNIIEVGGSTPVNTITKKTSSVALNTQKGAINTSDKSTVDVQFFPEGGDLVSGLRSKVAVKVIDHYGMGQNVTGTVIDNNNNVISTFITSHLGMGAFAYTPYIGNTYKVRVTLNDGSECVVDLPKPLDEGFTLTANATKADSIYLKVAANEQLLKKLPNNLFYVIAQQNGMVCYTAAGNLNSEAFTAGIAKSRFKSGLVQFTLFSADLLPVNERVVFVKNSDALDVVLKADTAYKPWQKINIGVDVFNKQKEPVQGSFSVAVADEFSTDSTLQASIFTDLLLRSNLKGNIENPGYYFAVDNDTTRENLDLLMMTQGYRKLLWKEVLSDSKPPIIYKPETGLVLDGMVLTPAGQPVIGGKVSITSLSKMSMIDTLTAVNGYFKFDNLNFADTSKIIINASKANGKKGVAIYIKQPDYPAIEKSDFSNQQLKLQRYYAVKTPLQTDTATKTKLKQVVIKGKRGHVADKYNNYGSIYEYDVNLAQLKDFNQLKEAVAHKIPGVIINGRGQLYYDDILIRVIINGLRRPQDDLNIYNLADIANIRLTEKGLLVVNTHKFFASDSVNIKLKEVNIRSRKIEKADKSNAYGSASPYTIEADRLKVGLTLNPGLAGRIPGAAYRDGVIYSLIYPFPLLHIVLNDHEISQTTDDINNYVRTDDIENVKILHGQIYKTLYGVVFNPKAHDLDDIILITTKQFAGTIKPESVSFKNVNLKGQSSTNYVTTDIPTNLITYKFKGYQVARQFYSPKYEAAQAARKYDDRKTIFWNPNVITDKDGHASFDFYSNGSKGVYNIIVEGIDASGNLGRKTLTYRVE